MLVMLAHCGKNVIHWFENVAKRKEKRERERTASNWWRAADALIIVIQQQCDRLRKMYDHENEFHVY